MANFARSLKSPYLSPRLRPSMPGRTVSSSSDVSLPSSTNSPFSEDFGNLSISGRNTPTLPNGRSLGRDGGAWGADGSSLRGKLVFHLCYDHESTASPATSRPTTPRNHNNHSRPITIELPGLKRFSTAPARTPPEPLSARGDLPGGYFPLHEDPNTRVHRPHPFQPRHDNRMARHQQVSLVADSRPAFADRTSTSSVQGMSLAHSNTPVASYLPAGFHDNPLPMGKYYPSNYEQRNDNHGSLRPSFAGSLAAHFHSDPNIIPRSSDIPTISTPESEVQRRLQQYQRDMVAQASMAANELLGSSADSAATLGSSVPLSSVRIRETRIRPPAALKPISPRLLPLGSPGPVTPMSLESGGSYMTLGRPRTLGMDKVDSPGGL
ncbi:hypothetical protein B0T10DRAFT_406328 [Thelonectria olida]|uniref:Uncharacterized protein n=1 Tax=Thelonectria olida TaxID=1576542 RepID=A0A9P8W1Q8_9HYPO|nr:hypothetical protein B0T10DRAFT_406328 [Thelonectria olida]